MLSANRPRKCKWCKESFTPERSGQKTHKHCEEPFALKVAEKLGAMRQKAERAQTRAKLEKLKRLWELIPEAQDAFNLFIRLRDRDKGCFVCGKPFPVGRMGGDFDAGHVRSRGAAGHLRFNEDNCHGECKECNSSFGAKPHEIEAGAIRRIGQERYDALKNDNTPHKWKRDEVRGIRDHYRALVRALKAQGKETA